MKVYTEVYSNYLLRSIAVNSRTKLKYPFTIGDTTYISGYLDAKCFMLLDVITTLIMHVVYRSGQNLNLKDKIPNQYSKQVFDKVQTFSRLEDTSYFHDKDNTRQMSRYGNSAPIELTFSKIKQLFPFVKLSNSEIEKTLRKMSDFTFSTTYKCTQVEDVKKEGVLIKRERVVRDYKLTYCRMFDIDFESDKFSLRFLLPFGILFLQNLFACNIRILNDQFYKLDEYSQNLYRFLATVPNKRICIDILAENLKVGISNKTLRNDRIEKWLEYLNRSNFLVNGRIVDKRWVDWDGLSYPGKKSKKSEIEMLREEIKEMKSMLNELLKKPE